jgi:hypothetical protein
VSPAKEFREEPLVAHATHAEHQRQPAKSTLAPRPPLPLALLLKRQRRSSGDLADAIGYSAKHLSKVKNGRLPATRLFRAAVVAELGLPESELFGDELLEVVG